MKAVFVTGDPGGGPCLGCGKMEDTRAGWCFDCASAAEFNAARRTVLQHIGRACMNVARGNFTIARIDLSWAVERLTGTGDYAPGGTFDAEYPEWRSDNQI